MDHYRSSLFNRDAPNGKKIAGESSFRLFLFIAATATALFFGITVILGRAVPIRGK
jgi:hypothetical protein